MIGHHPGRPKPKSTPSQTSGESWSTRLTSVHIKPYKLTVAEAGTTGRAGDGRRAAKLCQATEIETMFLSSKEPHMRYLIGKHTKMQNIVNSINSEVNN